MTTSPLWDFCIWVFFWAIVLIAVHWGIGDLHRWFKGKYRGQDDIRNFPRELLGEPGPESKPEPPAKEPAKTRGTVTERENG